MMHGIICVRGCQDEHHLEQSDTTMMDEAQDAATRVRFSGTRGLPCTAASHISLIYSLTVKSSVVYLLTAYLLACLQACQCWKEVKSRYAATTQGEAAKEVSQGTMGDTVLMV